MQNTSINTKIHFLFNFCLGFHIMACLRFDILTPKQVWSGLTSSFQSNIKILHYYGDKGQKKKFRKNNVITLNYTENLYWIHLLGPIMIRKLYLRSSWTKCLKVQLDSRIKKSILVDEVLIGKVSVTSCITQMHWIRKAQLHSWLTWLDFGGQGQGC